MQRMQLTVLSTSLIKESVCVSCFLSESEPSSSVLSPSRAVTCACTLDRFKMSQG